ncbi:C40 family peptidase [Arthrobacter sp. 35W]|uniref:C40 family peptidase n=1 Tax=Arthrobacter sp. 35W TaxID=1132441 RepID=UPI000417D80A|nr:C40 family peptidase [Arthrobacter sp. 35W]
MSSNTALGRHRAPSTSVNPLTAISKAVSSNAGTFGRQAAVVAAASGLIVSIGLPAQAAESGRVSTESSSAVQVAETVVSVPDTAAVSFARTEVASEPAPVKVAAPVAVQSNAVEATATAAAPKAAAAAPALAVSAGQSGVAAAAYAGIGSPYVWGGTSPSGWDCSGFVQWAYAQAGISIPRTNQWSVMVQTANPQPGDLVVQNGGVHVGIYVGNGMVISALNPSQGTLLLPASATGTSVFYTMG